MCVSGRDSLNPWAAISRPTSRNIHGLAPKPPTRKTNWETVRAAQLPKRTPNSYSIRRVSARCDFFDALDNGVDGRFKELLHLVPRWR